jgi:hypothetical protein
MIGRLLLTCALLTMLAAPSAAQGALNEGQGHPLKGTWIGDWGPTKQKRTPVLMVMDWDGKAISASLNPGPAAVTFTKAELNPADWSVRLESNAGGVSYVVTGKIENLGSARRTISGTWMQGKDKGDFKLTRQ